jgi:hypothetical protein
MTNPRAVYSGLSYWNGITWTDLTGMLDVAFDSSGNMYACDGGNIVKRSGNIMRYFAGKESRWIRVFVD